jgi:hypothetical protein
VTVTFSADQAARKESILSDVQVAGAKASAAQEVAPLCCSRADGAAEEDENVVKAETARNIRVRI